MAKTPHGQNSASLQEATQAGGLLTPGAVIVKMGGLGSLLSAVSFEFVAVIESVYLPPLQPKGAGLSGATRQQVGFPLKILD